MIISTIGRLCCGYLCPFLYHASVLTERLQEVQLVMATHHSVLYFILLEETQNMIQ